MFITPKHLEVPPTTTGSSPLLKRKIKLKQTEKHDSKELSDRLFIHKTEEIKQLRKNKV